LQAGTVVADEVAPSAGLPMDNFFVNGVSGGQGGGGAGGRGGAKPSDTAGKSLDDSLATSAGITAYDGTTLYRAPEPESLGRGFTAPGQKPADANAGLWYGGYVSGTTNTMLFGADTSGEKLGADVLASSRANALGDTGSNSRVEERGRVPVAGEVPVLGQLFRTEGGPVKGDTIVSNGQVLEFVGYDDPGEFVPQASTAGGAVGVPLPAQPVPRYRLKTPSTVKENGGTEAAKNVQDGRVLFEVGKYDEAEAKLRDVLRADPSNTQAFYYLSLAKEARFRGTEARKEVEVAQVDRAGETPLMRRTLNPRTLSTRSNSTSNDELEKAIAESGKDTRPYYEAKERLESLKRFGQILQLKMLKEGTDVALPKTISVDVLDEGKPAINPSGWGRFFGGGDFKSTARVKVERDRSDIQGIMEPQAMSNYDPYFVQTEFEVIQSDKVLGKVVAELNLNDAWAKKSGPKLKTEEAVALLKKRLDLKPVKNTSLIEIGVKSDKPDEAAKIANAVAYAYKGYRKEQTAKMTMGGIDSLAKQYQEHEQKLADARKEVERLRGEFHISDSDAQAAGPAKTSIPPTDAPLPRPKASTNAPIPQPEVQTGDNAFSTFSLNVSDVSFKLAAASLEKGQLPDSASIRSEEFINAFDYRDPEPAAGVPIGFAWERAHYPFAHNRDLLRFSLKTAALGRQAGRSLNLVLLLDTSGSMERADRVRIIREALRVLATQLQPQDRLSVVTFARAPRLVADGVAGDKANEVTDRVSGLTPEGGTNLEEAMKLAYETARRHYLASGINRVVLLTDGAANLGNVNPDSLKQKVEAQRKQGIALDCFGIGWEGLNDDLLEVLSRNGDGRYGFINTPEEAATEFAGQLAGALKVAASDVKVQVEFNPKRVTAFRQIGYAKHQLTKEQFRDNTVDAAEIAAQEAGNALYTVEVNPQGEGPLCTVRVRFKIPGTSDYREHEWPVPYNGSAVALEQSSAAMRLAGSASGFSEWLVASPFAAEVTPDRLLSYLSGVADVYGADTRPAKLEWMIRQARSIAGK
jgi:Mg-chelatase subunit ChlD/tetratricopeptide (TPR) repeat protein